MLRLTIDCTAPDGSIQGVKEAIAMALERWGDCRLVRVEEIPDQIGMEDINHGIKTLDACGEALRKWRADRAKR